MTDEPRTSAEMWTNVALVLLILLVAQDQIALMPGKIIYAATERWPELLNLIASTSATRWIYDLLMTFYPTL